MNAAPHIQQLFAKQNNSNETLTAEANAAIHLFKNILNGYHLLLEYLTVQLAHADMYELFEDQYRKERHFSKCQHEDISYHEILIKNYLSSISPDLAYKFEYTKSAFIYMCSTYSANHPESLLIELISEVLTESTKISFFEQIRTQSFGHPYKKFVALTSVILFDVVRLTMIVAACKNVIYKEDKRRSMATESKY